jgi:FtsP/CotA-like multicopper oxidase with cupredoxin domain
LGPLGIADWYHSTFSSVANAARSANAPPTADNILINGSMTSAYGGKYTRVHLQQGKKHLLRLLNVGINQHFHIALDEHDFTVVAADFVPVKPYRTNQVSLAVGQRVDVIIDANATASNYWMRVGTGNGCDGPNANVANVRAVFSYNSTDDSNPTSTAGPLDTGCADDVFEPYTHDEIPSATPEELEMGFLAAGGNTSFIKWTVNASSLQVDWTNPLLKMIQEGNTTFAKDLNVEFIEKGNGWSYWVVQQASTNPAIPHPIHLHGHDFYVLGSGDGQFNSSTATLNFSNPMKRDVASCPASGWLALAFKTDNPGTWLMHCHIPYHVQGGLGSQFVERRSDISGGLGNMDNECKAWKDWATDNSVGEGGSGL